MRRLIRPPPPATAAPVNDATTDDRALFRAALKDVRPLPTPPPPPAAPRPPARATFRRRDDAEVLAESLALGPGELLVETGDELLFRRAQITARTLDRLRRGEYTVRDELDLHGMTSSEAKAAVRAFLAHAVSERLRCVRSVHGKGLGSGPRGPVLKGAVNVWLRNSAAVLAFSSARPVDGGTGALYVLLGRD